MFSFRSSFSLQTFLSVINSLLLDNMFDQNLHLYMQTSNFLKMKSVFRSFERFYHEKKNDMFKLFWLKLRTSRQM